MTCTEAYKEHIMYTTLNTSDKYFTAPYEEYPVTICGQTIILANGELAALLSLPEREKEIIYLYFRELHTTENGRNVQTRAEYHEPPHT